MLTSSTAFAGLDPYARAKRHGHPKDVNGLNCSCDSMHELADCRPGYGVFRNSSMAM
jgi:hypothetical protein